MKAYEEADFELIEEIGNVFSARPIDRFVNVVRFGCD